MTGIGRRRTTEPVRSGPGNFAAPDRCLRDSRNAADFCHGQKEHARRWRISLTPCRCPFEQILSNLANGSASRSGFFRPGPGTAPMLHESSRVPGRRRGRKIARSTTDIPQIPPVLEDPPLDDHWQHRRKSRDPGQIRSAEPAPRGSYGFVWTGTGVR
jgi:hypothetical protein